MARSGIAAAFGPLDYREPADTQSVQPVALFTGRKVDVRLGPASRPVILAAIKGGTAQPVGQGELLGIVDPEAPLLQRVHHEQSAQRPVRLSAHRVQRLAVQHDHRTLGSCQLMGDDQTRQSGADHDDITVHRLNARTHSPPLLWAP